MYVSRKNKAQLLSGVEAVESKLLARNTVRYVRPDGATAYRYHATDVVTIFPDGSIQLDSGGWKTVTTKDRMGYGLPSGWGIYSVKGVWYVRTPAGEFLFEDGAKFRANGKPFKASKLKDVTLRNRQKADERLIKRYCAKVANEPWPTDSGGDPWVWPDATGKLSEEHVRSFLKEQYVFLSMFGHVQKWSGMSETWLGMIYHHDKPGGDDRKHFASKVRRYLRACLGYAV